MLSSGVDASPLMTWGTIEGTPFQLETDVIPSAGPSFKMPKIPKREEITETGREGCKSQQGEKEGSCTGS